MPATGAGSPFDLIDSLSAGGFAILLAEEDDAAACAEALAAAAGDAALVGRLSEHAGGRGDLAPWLCLAFGLAPFDPIPAPQRLSAFFASAPSRPLLIVEASDRMEKSELSALRRVTGQGLRCAVILIGPEAASERLRAAAPAPLAAEMKLSPAPPAGEASVSRPRPRPGVDPFAVIAHAVVRPAPAAPACVVAPAPPPSALAPEAAPAPRARRGRPYGAKAAAAAAFLSVVVIGGLMLVEQPAGGAVATPEPERLAAAPAPELQAAAPEPVIAPPPPEASEAATAPEPAAPPLSVAEAAPPAAEGPRVTIHYGPSSRDQANMLLAALRRAGFADVALWPVESALDETGVRYFDEADAATAALLDAALIEALAPRAHFEPERPGEIAAPQGTLEIWLAG